MEISENILHQIDHFLLQHPFPLKEKELVFSQCFNETWFSNTLAWLLNPKGSHNLGIQFTKKFLEKIARIRTENPEKYARKETLLKWGKKGRGVSSKTFSLKNAATVREFYFAGSIERGQEGGPRYCDIMLLDLDTSDGLAVVIENKLFTSNRPGQLESYYLLAEKSFKRAKVREYLYLTLFGLPPLQHGDGTPRLLKEWVCMSWCHDILEILNSFPDNRHEEVVRLQKMLSWMAELGKASSSNLALNLHTMLLQSTAVLLLEELNRLGEGKPGEWHLHRKSDHGIVLIHTSAPKRLLFAELLPNLSLVVQSRSSNRALYEKIYIPFGLNSDQYFNILDITARNIYHLHFQKPDRYLADRRRMNSSVTPAKKRMLPVIEYLSRHKYMLQIILATFKFRGEIQS